MTKPILLISLLLSGAAANAQYNDSSYWRTAKTGDSAFKWIYNSSVGSTSDAAIIKAWKYDLSQSWYQAWDSAHKIIWKWRYMSDTMYIDTTKIKTLIYLK